MPDKISTTSQTPPPRLGIGFNSTKPRIKIMIPQAGQNFTYFNPASPYVGTARSNPSQFSGLGPQWPPSSPYPGAISPVPTGEEGLYKQFEGLKDFTWDWTKAGLNQGEKSAFYLYEKVSKWSRKGFTHMFLILIVCLYSVAGAYIFANIERGAVENSTATFNNLKINFSKKLYELAQIEENYNNLTRWEEKATSEINALQTDLVALFKSGYFDVDKIEKTETWSFLNSIFYCGTIYTTIGYGHISPATKTGKAVTIVYAIFGIPILLILLADLGKWFTRSIKMKWAYVRRLYYTGSLRRVRKQTQVQEVLRGMNIAYEIATFRRPSMMMKESDVEQTQTPTSPSGTPTTPIPPEIDIDDEFNLPISLALVILLAYIFSGAYFYTITEKWTFFESCYFVFISMSTIGFGDYVPKQPVHMIGSIVYLIFGLSLTSMCINVVQLKLSDSFKQASAKISATIGLTLAEEEARSSQNLTPLPENVSVHSNSYSLRPDSRNDSNRFDRKSDNTSYKFNPVDFGTYDNAEIRGGAIVSPISGRMTLSTPPPPSLLLKRIDVPAPKPKEKANKKVKKPKK